MYLCTVRAFPHESVGFKGKIGWFVVLLMIRHVAYPVGTANDGDGNLSNNFEGKVECGLN